MSGTLSVCEDCTVTTQRHMTGFAPEVDSSRVNIAGVLGWGNSLMEGEGWHIEQNGTKLAIICKTFCALTVRHSSAGGTSYLKERMSCLIFTYNWQFTYSIIAYLSAKMELWSTINYTPDQLCIFFLYF